MSFDALKAQLKQISEKLYYTMDRILPIPAGTREERLFEAMRYVTLSHGKRLRPFLLVSSANLFGVGQDSSLLTAAAVEFIHTYSLVHDDLPAMDDDDLRRGQLSCHKKYDEATAILVGDALLTYAFEVLADASVHQDAGVRVELIQAIAQASGFSGMAGGQMLDLLAEHVPLELSEIVRMQRMKTGELFATSCEAGAILGKALRPQRNALRAYAHSIGIAFQIIDDLLDAEGTRAETGKAVGKDQERGKATLISCIGVDQARAHAELLTEQAINHLSCFDSRADCLRDLAKYVITRYN